MKKLILTFALTITPILAFAQNSAIYSELSMYHFNLSPNKLEEIAGGTDALVNELVILRHSTHPFVSIRAAKLLLNYTDRSEVVTALSSDIDSTEYKGITKAIAINIDSTKDLNTRASFASKIVSKAKFDSDLKGTLGSLEESKDPVVKSIARTSN